jgi:Arc/MetJ-type ribon-helix-helix transcriptional regulator
MVLMETMNISLPDSLKGFVDSRVKTGGYSSVSEYVRDLVREDQKRQTQENRPPPKPTCLRVRCSSPRIIRLLRTVSWTKLRRHHRKRRRHGAKAAAARRADISASRIRVASSRSIPTIRKR